MFATPFILLDNNLQKMIFKELLSLLNLAKVKTLQIHRMKSNKTLCL